MDEIDIIKYVLLGGVFTTFGGLVEKKESQMFF